MAAPYAVPTLFFSGRGVIVDRWSVARQRHKETRQEGWWPRERSEALAISYRPRSQYRVSFIRDLMVLLYVNEIPNYKNIANLSGQGRTWKAIHANAIWQCAGRSAQSLRAGGGQSSGPKSRSQPLR